MLGWTIEIPINNISSLSFLTSWFVLCCAFLVQDDGATGRTDGRRVVVLRGTFLLCDHITDLLLLCPALALIDSLTALRLTRGTLLSIGTSTGHLLQ